MGIAMFGAGHGSSLFWALVASPEPFGFLVWPVIGIGLPWVKKRWIKYLIILLLVGNYIGVACNVYREDSEYLIRTFRSEFVLSNLLLGAYVTAQVAIIGFLFRSKDVN